MFRSSAKKSKELEEKARNDVQVEVSLDLFEKLCSIVVTEDTRLQTVVSVPSETSGNRHRFFRAPKAVAQDPNAACNISQQQQSKKKAEPGRLADSMRPLSPAPRDRQLGMDDQKPVGRGRERVSSSCPPPLHRGGGPERTAMASADRIREHSCPPTYNRSSPRSLSRQQRPSRKNAAVVAAATNKKSKDLVSKAASRSRVFGSMRKASKVIPAMG